MAVWPPSAEDLMKVNKQLQEENKQLRETLRDKFAMAAPAEEVESIVPDTCGDICRFLGLNVDLNANRNAYPDDALLQATAKARYIWADAMLKERDK